MSSLKDMKSSGQKDEQCNLENNDSESSTFNTSPKKSKRKVTAVVPANFGKKVKTCESNEVSCGTPSTSVEVQSDEQCNFENNDSESSTINTSPKKSKRKVTSVVPANSGKKVKTCESTEVSCGTPSTSVLEDVSEIESTQLQDTRSTVDFNGPEIENVLKEMDFEIDKVITEKARKNKLTASNVRNILRYVITNEHVMSMVRNSMKCSEDDELEEAVYEPKLTRSKAKELREKQYDLPWLVCSPLKQEDDLASKKLLEEEFSDESLSDEDYEPKKEEEEEEVRSDDDDCPSSQLTEIEESEEKSPVCSPASEGAEDANEDENCLVIDLPQVAEYGESEADKIALRTRSKLPLNDTPLETIEASFIAPDITVDMYDTECDNEDWQTFLRDLSLPLESEVVVEQPEDDVEDDPEYNILQDDDIPDSWDLRNDKAVKISRKELNALMAEILESAENDFFEEEEEETVIPVIENVVSASSLTDSMFAYNIMTPIDIMPIVQNVVHFKVFEKSNEKLRLEEQMRMHVQLLTQSYVLSYGMKDLSYIYESSKTFLNELKMFATREAAYEKDSAFNAYNLNGALDIVKDFESSNIRMDNSFIKKKGIPSINSLKARHVLAESKVFLYPDLLPICSFRDDILGRQKTTFTASEDNLIAIGLEEFDFCKDPVRYIQSLLMPAKTEHQIKIRIKNSRTMKAPPNNPIKYYYKYKQAPMMKKAVASFDQANVKAPRENPPDWLPQWMRPYSKAKPQLKPVALRPLVAKPLPPGAIPYQHMQNTIDKRKLNPIAARGLHHLSPLKTISPILRKYNQQRRATQVFIQWQLPNKPRKTKFNRQNYKPPPIKPRPPCLNESVCSSSAKLDVTNANVPAGIKPAVPAPVVFAVPAIPPLNPESSRHHKNDSPAEVKKRPSLKRSATQHQRKETKAVLPTKRRASGHKSSVAVSLRPRKEKPGSKSKLTDAKSESETVEEVEEEPVDDEHDLAALMLASSTICKKQTSNKKRNKIQRDMESTLALLKPNLVESDPKREEREQLFASSYILRVADALKGDTETYEKFLKTLCRYQHSTKSPVHLYFELKEVLKDHSVLIDDFVAFLRPDQAKECGKFKEYTLYYKIREFLRKLEVHFGHQPQHLLRILKTFGQLRSQTDITSKEVLSTLQPLLRNQSHLMEELSQLLPDTAPPESLMGEEDFEDITIPNSDDDNSSIDSCEEIIIPDIPDPYGGKNCPCKCHTMPGESKQQSKSKHCMNCGLKFIDGRIYVQSGKTLKPVQVTYHDKPDSTTNQNDATVFKKPNETISSSHKIPESESHIHKKDIGSHHQTKLGTS